MRDFAKEIQQFQRYGTYVYKFDATGNLTFNSSSVDFSRVYVSVPLQNFDYKKSKVDSYYDSEFKEFVPTVSQEISPEINEEIRQQVGLLESENETLKTRLDELTSRSDDNSSSANVMATKEVILELRKSLGQGRVDSDFSEDFPYSPIRKEI